MAERTGSLVLKILWSYVKVVVLKYNMYSLKIGSSGLVVHGPEVLQLAVEVIVINALLAPQTHVLIFVPADL